MKHRKVNKGDGGALAFDFLTAPLPTPIRTLQLTSAFLISLWINVYRMIEPAPIKLHEERGEKKGACLNSVNSCIVVLIK